MYLMPPSPSATFHRETQQVLETVTTSKHRTRYGGACNAPTLLSQSVESSTVRSVSSPSPSPSPSDMSNAVDSPPDPPEDKSPNPETCVHQRPDKTTINSPARVQRQNSVRCFLGFSYDTIRGADRSETSPFCCSARRPPNAHKRGSQKPLFPRAPKGSALNKAPHKTCCTQQKPLQQGQRPHLPLPLLLLSPVDSPRRRHHPHPRTGPETSARMYPPPAQRIRAPTASRSSSPTLSQADLYPQPST